MAAYKIDQKFNVVILYDELASGNKAMATYSRLVRQLGSRFRSKVRIWRLDVAAAAEFAAPVARDLTAAEMVIVAVHDSQPRPEAFRCWTEGRSLNGGPPGRALVALIETDDEPGPAAEAWSSFLREIARQSHMSFFAWEPHPIESEKTRPVESNKAEPEPLASGLESAAAGATAPGRHGR